MALPLHQLTHCYIMLDHSKFMTCKGSKKALDYLPVVGLSIGDMTRIILVILFSLI